MIIAKAFFPHDAVIVVVCVQGKWGILMSLPLIRALKR